MAYAIENTVREALAMKPIAMPPRPVARREPAGTFEMVASVSGRRAGIDVEAVVNVEAAARTAEATAS